MLDIFPSHKEVVIEHSPEDILRAINDRAVTRLLVEDRPSSEPTLGRATLASTNILTAIAYSPGGRVVDPDLSVAGNTATENYVSDVLDKSENVEVDVREDIRTSRKNLLKASVPVETHPRLTVEEALAKLT